MTSNYSGGVRWHTAWGRRAGIAAPLVFTAAWLAAGWAQPGFDPRIDHISALSAVNAPIPWLMVGGFVVAGLLLLLFASALHATAGGRPVGALLVGLAGGAMLIIGLVREDDPAARATGVPASLSDRIHDAASFCLLLALLLAPVAIARDRWRWSVGPLLLVGAALVTGATLVVGLIYLLDVVVWSGLVQRLLISLPLAWLLGLALTLGRWPPSPPRV